MATKILVIDDDTNICDLLEMYLVKEGYEVKTVNDGVEGITAFRMYEPDLVLLDISRGNVIIADDCRVLFG